jgi:hypothetical protein
MALYRSPVGFGRALLCGCVSLGLAGGGFGPVSAAGPVPDVVVRLVEDGQGAEHRSVSLGGALSFALEVTGGVAGLVSWASGSPGVAGVSGDDAGAVVSGLAEGVAVVSVAVVVDGVAHSDACAVSVVSRLEESGGAYLSREGGL